MNELEKRNKKHSRKQHGLSPFNSMNTDAGNVEHNIAMFNKMNSSTDKSCTTSVGSPSGSEGLAESVSWGAYEDFEYINDMYLPATGEGDSKATQAVTAVNKLVFKYYNDGDVYDNVHSGLEGWANDISSFANWLYKYVPETSSTLGLVYDIVSESEYEDLLFKLTTIVLDEKLLAKLSGMPKVGSVYDCEGPFEFSEYVEEEDDDYSDEEEEYFDFNEEVKTPTTTPDNKKFDEVSAYYRRAKELNCQNESKGITHHGSRYQMYKRRIEKAIANKDTEALKRTKEAVMYAPAKELKNSESDELMQMIKGALTNSTEKEGLNESTSAISYLNDALEYEEITQEQFNAAKDIRFEINGEDITLFIQGYPYDLSEIESVKYSEYAGKYDGAYEVTTVDGSMIILGWYNRDPEATLYKVTLFEEFLNQDNNDSTSRVLKETFYVDNDNNKIEIDYDNLNVFIVTRSGSPSGYFDTSFGNWLPDEDSGYETSEEYTYTADKDDVINVFYDDVEEELSKKYSDKYSDLSDDDWVEYVLKYIDDNIDSLLKKYESQIKEYFKDDAQEAAQEYYNESLSRSTKTQKNKCSLKETSYGGAYDISPDAYFTREDIVNAAEALVDHVNETFPVKYTLGGTWFENNEWIVKIQTEDGFEEYESSIKVDMRKIRKPIDLKNAYVLPLAADIIKQIKSLNEDVYSEWKPDTSFKHIKDIYNKVKANNYKYVNNEREEFMAAVKKADKGGYKPEERKQIRDWHKEIWRSEKSK